MVYNLLAQSHNAPVAGGGKNGGKTRKDLESTLKSTTKCWEKMWEKLLREGAGYVFCGQFACISMS